MADPLYELLSPFFENASTCPSPRDPLTASYLARLSTLSLPDLTFTEPASLQYSSQSHLRNLQALSKRSHKAVISSTSHIERLSSLIPELITHTGTLSNGLPELETSATDFVQKYDRSTENAVLDRRKRAMLLSRNADRVSDVLDLPSLLSSTVSAAQAGGLGSSSSAGASTSYSLALDLHAHIKRLDTLFPQSDLVRGVSARSEVEIQNLATVLITSLQSPTLKLAAAMRTIGWLRRVAPELAEDVARRSRPTSSKSLSFSTATMNRDGALGSLFLICRLHALHKTIEALDPLRDLADQETARRRNQENLNGAAVEKSPSGPSSTGSHSERYLKRYIEIFREQSFNILSMYRSIFPSNFPLAEDHDDENDSATVQSQKDPLLPLPSPVASLALHLVQMFTSPLKEIMPNVTDKAARESLLTQVLYCAGSLGRLGADFGMMIALLDSELRATGSDVGTTLGDLEEPEWVQIMKKHRVQASRLEVLARGVESRKKSGAHPPSPSPISSNE